MKKAIIITLTLFALVSAVQIYGENGNGVIGVVDTVVEEEELEELISDYDTSLYAVWMRWLLAHVGAHTVLMILLLALLIVFVIGYISEFEEEKYKKMLDVMFLKCTKTVRQNPNNDELRVNENYEKMVKKTLVKCTKKLRWKQTDADAYYIRALMYAVQGLYNEAIADCSEAILLNPSLPRAYLIRGISYCSKNHYDQAITDFDAALKINPDDENVKLLIEEAKKLN